MHIVYVTRLCRVGVAHCIKMGGCGMWVEFICKAQEVSMGNLHFQVHFVCDGKSKACISNIVNPQRMRRGL